MFRAVEIDRRINEGTGVRFEAENEEGILDKISFFNEEKVYWNVYNDETGDEFRVSEDMELEKIVY